MTEFRFNDYDKLSDGEIEITLQEKEPAPPGEGYVPQYHFNIHLAGRLETIGKIRLRVGDTERTARYAGNIGYEINEGYRGHRYAARACNLVRRVALDHGLKTCWITCRPENLPSRRICEIIGAEFIGIINIPEDYDMYRRGYRQMCRFRWDLER
jgi:predicted acetyltransferase